MVLPQWKRYLAVWRRTMDVPQSGLACGARRLSAGSHHDACNGHGRARVREAAKACDCRKRWQH